MAKSSEFFTSQRVLTLMVFLGFMFHHMLRVNISIAIVEMIWKNNTSNTTGALHVPHYNWNEEEKNDILGYFFWGYVITQIPGGRLSEKFGTKIVVGIGLLSASILTLLTPTAPEIGHRWLVFLRLGLGIAMGIHWPSTHPLAAKWIAPGDMSKFMSHMTASSLGVAITLPVCGYLIAYCGWPSVFYVTGSIALTWSLLWFYLIYDSPDEHPRISSTEKEKLRNQIPNVQSSVKKLSTPWKKMMLSLPVWAIIVGNSGASCTFFIAFNQLPTYMSQVLHFNIKENGWFSSLPYLVRYFMSISSSIAADKIIKSGRFSTTATRKFFTVSLFLGTTFLFTIQAFWGDSRIVSVIVFSGSLGLMGLATPGIYTNPVDIAPAFSGTIFGISQVPGCIIGYLTTKFVAFVTRDRQGFEEWSYVFWMLVVTNLFAAVFCYFSICGVLQSWSVNTTDKELEKLETTETIR